MSTAKISKTKADPKVETRTVTKPNTKTLVGVIDTTYQNILDRAALSFCDVQKSSLIWAYELGELFEEFETKVVSQTTGRTIEVFIKDLEERGVDVGAGKSTLYFSRKFFKKYENKKKELPSLAAAGCGTFHLKQLFALEDDPKLLAMVNEILIQPDGTMISGRKLAAFIAEKRQVAAIANTTEAARATPSPRAEKASQSSQRTVGNVIPDESGVADSDDAPGADAPAQTPGAKAKAKSEDGKTGSRGATPVKTYSVSPQKVLRATDSAATKLLSSLADTIITATEITKIGFDHPPTKDKVRELLTAAKTGISELLRALPDVEKRLQEALDDVSG